jgi:E-phenylitaconyl-CoA hydratase
MIADSEMELRAARLLTYQAAWKADSGGATSRWTSSIAKVTATETAGRVVDRCIQILGGMGVSQELPLERWYRELRIKRIGEGPSEVHRMVLARQPAGHRPLTVPEEGKHVHRPRSARTAASPSSPSTGPHKRNALDAEHYQALSEAWTRVRDDDAIRVAVVTGAGDKVVQRRGRPQVLDRPRVELGEMWQTQKGMLLNRGLEIWKPVIAALNGHCLAGGMTLMLATDIRVAAEHRQPSRCEVKRGIIAANGGTQRLLDQLPHAIAMEMLLTGDAIDADTALRWGSGQQGGAAAQLMDDGAGLCAQASPPMRRWRCRRPRSWRCAREPGPGRRPALRAVRADHILRQTEDAKEGRGPSPKSAPRLQGT